MRYLPFVILLGLGLSSCSRLGYEATKTAEGVEAMVVSAHDLATRAGVEILREGGSATDAAIATQFALAVVCPRAGNLGGGGFMLIAPPEDVVRAIDYRERAPAAATRNMYLRADGSVHPDRSLLGPLAAGIPGTVDGLWLAYTFDSHLGDWSRLLQPAIKLAREGYRVSPEEARRLNRYANDFRAVNTTNTRFPFLKATDQTWKTGDRLVQTTLANTLDSIAVQGASYFYEGSFAKRLTAEVRTRGGIWTEDDLLNYRSSFREPVSFKYDKYTVYGMSPPSSGGVAMAQMAGLLAAYDLNDILRRDTVEYYHLIIESMRRAYEDRAQYLGDPDYVDVPVDSLMAANYLKGKWASYQKDSATDSGIVLRALGKDVYETTHTSVVDAYGGAVSVTTTLNGNFGSKAFSTTGGFFLNNEMDDFSAKPGVPNQFGLVGGEANAIAPGKRMLSSMTPTIVAANGRPVLVLGSPGGSTIITAVWQVILNDLAHGQSLQEAVDRPRIHHQWLPDEVVMEKGAISPRVQAELEAKGHRFRVASSIGRVKAIGRDGEMWIGVGDRRSPDDSARGY